MADSQSQREKNMSWDWMTGVRKVSETVLADYTFLIGVAMIGSTEDSGEATEILEQKPSVNDELL